MLIVRAQLTIRVAARSAFLDHLRDLAEASRHVAAFKARVGTMIASREPTRVYMVSQVGGF